MFAQSRMLKFGMKQLFENLISSRPLLVPLAKTWTFFFYSLLPALDSCFYAVNSHVKVKACVHGNERALKITLLCMEHAFY